jgi:hypothetical protein
MKKAVILILATMLTAGCLVRETRHTLYLDPDGGVTWQVSWFEVRSDAAEAERRAGEERDFLAEVREGSHDVALALDLLGPRRLDSRVLRERRPFSVSFEARFDRVDRLARDLFEQLDAPASVELWQEGEVTHLSFTVEIAEPGDDGDERLLALLDEPKDYRLFLTEGKFVGAEGFRIEESGAVAVPEKRETEGVDSLSWRLSWTR